MTGLAAEHNLADGRRNSADRHSIARRRRAQAVLRQALAGADRRHLAPCRILAQRCARPSGLLGRRWRRRYAGPGSRLDLSCYRPYLPPITLRI